MPPGIRLTDNSLIWLLLFIFKKDNKCNQYNEGGNQCDAQIAFQLYILAPSATCE